VYLPRMIAVWCAAVVMAGALAGCSDGRPTATFRIARPAPGVAVRLPEGSGAVTAVAAPAATAELTAPVQFDGRSEPSAAAGNGHHVLTVSHTASYLGRWYAHDYELCVGQAPDFAAYDPSTGEMPCGGNGASGYERLWGCGYPEGGCGFAWIPLTFAYHADGTVTATASAAPVPVPKPAGGAFYDDGLTICTLNGTGKIVPCNGGTTGIPPEGLTPGSLQLSLVTGGVLKETLPPGYWGGTSYDVCGTAASQADHQRYCPNG
jgi:hypothetical protein